MRTTISRLSAGYYVVTAITTLATSYYLTYLFFLLRDRFAYGDRQNLWVSALHGAVYVVAAWQCGKFAERRGYHTSLRVGLSGTLLCMIAGAVLPGVSSQVLVLATYTSVLLFIWPALEALITQHQPASRTPHLIGMYNCTWSGAAAVSYFAGGSVYDRLGPDSVFWVPVCLFAGLLCFVSVLARRARALTDVLDDGGPRPIGHAGERAGRSSVDADTFLRLAWLANPFSYVAIYTLFAVMPGVALRLGLSPTQVGWFCSVWLFGRLAAFVILWRWQGWHYRFRWLLGASVMLTAGFVVVLLAGTLPVLVIGQVAFGLAAGLIYYSSLFYAMDVGAAKAEHGGLHEAAIGIGICAGPAVGALSVTFLPAYRQAAAAAVTALLLCGCVALILVWSRARRLQTR